MMPNQPANAPGISSALPHRSAYSIDAFCKAHDISRAFFYELGEAGLGPRLMKLGRRVLISQEAAADWRREMEERTASQAQVAAYCAEERHAEHATDRAGRTLEPVIHPKRSRVKAARRSVAGTA